MSGCCWCCSALRPRYKRLVDNIFPVNPQVSFILLISIKSVYNFCIFSFLIFVYFLFSYINTQNNNIIHNIDNYLNIIYLKIYTYNFFIK